MKWIFISILITLSACTNMAPTTVPVEKQGFWVVQTGYGDAEKIVLKKHQGDDEIIDSSKQLNKPAIDASNGRVSSPVLDTKGKLLAYFKEKLGNGRSLVIHNLASGQSTTHPVRSGTRVGMSWSADSQKLFFSDRSNVAWFDRGIEDMRYHLRYKDPEGFSASPDGRYLAFKTREGKHINAVDGWLLRLKDLQKNTFRQLGTLDDDKSNFSPFYWSPDSQKILVGTHYLGKGGAITKSEMLWYTLDYVPLGKPTDDDLIYHPQHFPHVISIRHAREDGLFAPFFQR